MKKFISLLAAVAMLTSAFASVASAEISAENPMEFNLSVTPVDDPVEYYGETWEDDFGDDYAVYELGVTLSNVPGITYYKSGANKGKYNGTGIITLGVTIDVDTEGSVANYTDFDEDWQFTDTNTPFTGADTVAEGSEIEVTTGMVVLQKGYEYTFAITEITMTTGNYSTAKSYTDGTEVDYLTESEEISFSDPVEIDLTAGDPGEDPEEPATPSFTYQDAEGDYAENADPVGVLGIAATGTDEEGNDVPGFVWAGVKLVGFSTYDATGTYKAIFTDDTEATHIEDIDIAGEIDGDANVSIVLKTARTGVKMRLAWEADAE